MKKRYGKKNKVNIISMLVISIILLIVNYLIYLLQADVFPHISIAGVVPNLFVIYILIIGLYGNNFLSMLIGIVGGLWIDFLYGEVIGITSVMLCSVGFIATWFDTLWSKDEKISIIIMCFLATLFFEFGVYFLKSIVLKFDMEILSFFKILIIEEIYNILLIIIFFKLIKKLGYTMERHLKRNNMYTVIL